MARLTAIGRVHLELGGRRHTAEPIFSESAGGRGFGNDFTLTDIERKIARESGVNQKDFEAGAKRYVPGRANSLE